MAYDIVPGAIFTKPEVGKRRISGKAQVIGELAGQLKLISAGSTKKFLGVHIAGPHATDLLAEATLAIQMGTETIHAHPTLAEVMLEASFKSLDMPLHG